jgi:hypothetical protein
LKEAMKYKFRWDKELERRKKLGITGPEPLPHPDDIVIDMKSDQVILKGPMTDLVGRRLGLPHHQGDRRQAADHDFNDAGDLAFAGLAVQARSIRQSEKEKVERDRWRERPRISDLPSRLFVSAVSVR